MIFSSWRQKVSIFIALPCVIFFLVGSMVQAATPTPGTLIADLPVPLVVEGKTVGSMTLKAGTQISVITILPNDGGVVISRGGGAPFIVPKTALTQESLLLAMAASATPSPTPAPLNPPVVPATATPIAVVKPIPSTAPATPQAGAAAETDFITESNNGIITITGYTGVGRDVVIPNTINGLPIGVIGSDSFKHKKTLCRLVIPDSVTTIAYLSINDCPNLTNIALPKNLKTIFNPEGAPNLSLITLDQASDNFTLSPDGVLFDSKQTKLIFYPPGKKDTAYTVPNGVKRISGFAGSTNLLCVNLPETVNEIGSSAFKYCTGLKEIVIPNNVTQIESYAFKYCHNLTTVTIGKGVTDMGNGVFSGCSKLQKVLFEGDAPGIGGTTLENTGKSLRVYYHAKAKGFTSPVWVDSGGGKWNSSMIND